MPWPRLATAAAATPVLALFHAIGYSFASTRLSGRAYARHGNDTAATLFGACFANTVSLYALVLLDVGALFDTDTMLLAWRAALSCLLAHVLVITPCYALYTAAAKPHAQGQQKRRLSGGLVRGLACAVLGDAALLYVLWTAEFAPDVSAGKSSSLLYRRGTVPEHELSWQYVLSRCMRRAAVLGVALAAVLAGYAAVWWPFSTASVFALEADPGALGRLQRSYVAALSQLVTKQKRIALLLAERDGAADALPSGHPKQGGHASPSASQQSRGPVGRVLSRLASFARRGSEQLGSTNAAASQAATLSGLQLEAELLRDLCASLGDDLAQCLAAVQRSASSRSWRGRLDDGAALATSVFCLVHLYRSLRHLVLGEADGDMTASLDLVSTALQREAADAVAGGVGSGGGKLRLYATVASVALIGFVTAASLRTFFDTVQRLAQRLARGGVWPGGSSGRNKALQGGGKRVNKTTTGVSAVGGPGLTTGASIILLASQTTGLYGLASVLLMRDRLPRRPKETLGAALGKDVPFRFFEDAFDAMYVATALVTVCVLGVQYQQQKRALRGD